MFTDRGVFIGFVVIYRVNFDKSKHYELETKKVQRRNLTNTYEPC